MLLTNRGNLFEIIKTFVAQNDNITILSAYLKQNLLQELIDCNPNGIGRIVVRWEGQDLVNGASDIEVYETCKENGIALFRNPKLHAKAIVSQNNKCILGSANFTNKGLKNTEHSNFELNTELKELDLFSKSLIEEVVLNSILINDTSYEYIKEQIKKFEPATAANLIEFDEIDKDNAFLISSLPMCNHPELLWEIYNQERILHLEEMNSASHDLALFNIKKSINNKEEFLLCLQKAFNNHLFVKLLKEEIKTLQTMNYGSVVRFIQNNCINVPLPRSWELKQKLVVNILYDWICYFDENYELLRKYPNGSDLIKHLN